MRHEREVVSSLRARVTDLEKQNHALRVEVGVARGKLRPWEGADNSWRGRVRSWLWRMFR